mmetsp:Transcript_54183/g.117059  ORF Transcript_54183/g.117059 Transcript_54183/m.117059 type:complete len:250 (+) Transcript_54183:444-1193(+)
MTSSGTRGPQKLRSRPSWAAWHRRPWGRLSHSGLSLCQSAGHSCRTVACPWRQSQRRRTPRHPLRRQCLRTRQRWLRLCQHRRRRTMTSKISCELGRRCCTRSLPLPWKSRARTSMRTRPTSTWQRSPWISRKKRRRSCQRMLKRPAETRPQSERKLRRPKRTGPSLQLRARSKTTWTITVSKDGRSLLRSSLRHGLPWLAGSTPRAAVNWVRARFRALSCRQSRRTSGSGSRGFRRSQSPTVRRCSTA